MSTLSREEENELQGILKRGHWAGTRFIPQPRDAARYHLLTEKLWGQVEPKGESE